MAVVGQVEGVADDHPAYVVLLAEGTGQAEFEAGRRAQPLDRLLRKLDLGV